MDSQSKRIVQNALHLRGSHPHAPALSVLDVVLSGKAGADLDFDDPAQPGGNHTDPGAAFGQLLRAAFAPEISDTELRERGGPAGEQEFLTWWRDTVIEPFALRYALWSGMGDDAGWISRCAAQIRKRWPQLEASEADGAAVATAKAPLWRQCAAEAAADSYVRQGEERGTLMRGESAFQLVLHVDGASDADLARGLAAAHAVFTAAGITPAKGARGLFNRERWDVQGFPEDAEPSPEDLDAASAWDDADRAAAQACCAGWPAAPESAGLELAWR